jgi:hypothetical protein
VLRNLQLVFVVLALAVVGVQSGYAQDKSQGTKIELKLDKTITGYNPRGWSESFGTFCKSVKQESGKDWRSYHPSFDKPVSIAELMGEPIKVVIIHYDGRSWKKSHDVRRRIANLLRTQSGREVGSSPTWDEAVFQDIVATIQFSDHVEGAMEVSGYHVCFTDHSGMALWLRVLPNK